MVGGEFRKLREGCDVLLTFSIKKPQDISEPVSQSTPKHLDILAGLYVLAEPHQEALYLRYYGTPDVTHQMQELQTAYEEEDDQSHQILVIDNKPSAEYSHKPIYQRPKNTVCKLVNGQALHSLIGPDGWGSPRYLSAKDVRRWNCLAKLLRRSDLQEAANKLVLGRKPLPVANENIKLGVNIEELLRSTDKQIVDSLVPHEENFTILMSFNRRGKGFDMFFLGWFEDPVLVSILITLSIVYGGIHLAVWNSKFASTQESLLWKVACIDIMTTFLAAWPASSLAAKWIDLLFYSMRGSFGRAIGGVFIYLTVAVLGLFYFLSRLYLVVESFISLRHVPIGVYTTIPWVQNIPHIYTVGVKNECPPTKPYFSPHQNFHPYFKTSKWLHRILHPRQISV
jgi:hypothetical protein